MAQNGCQAPDTMSYFQLAGRNKDYSGILSLSLKNASWKAYATLGLTDLWAEFVTWPYLATRVSKECNLYSGSYAPR